MLILKSKKRLQLKAQLPTQLGVSCTDWPLDLFSRTSAGSHPLLLHWSISIYAAILFTEAVDCLHWAKPLHPDLFQQTASPVPPFNIKPVWSVLVSRLWGWEFQSRQWQALLGSVSCNTRQYLGFIHRWVRTAFLEEMFTVFPVICICFFLSLRKNKQPNVIVYKKSTVPTLAQPNNTSKVQDFKNLQYSEMSKK